MNLLLLTEADRISGDLFQVAGRRAEYIKCVLRAVPGGRIKAGLLGGNIGIAELRKVERNCVELVCPAFDIAPPESSESVPVISLPRPQSFKKTLHFIASSGIKKAYPSTLSLKASVIDSSTAGGNFCTFGIPDQPSAENILSLFVVIKDGRRFCYQFIVTNQVRTAPNPMNVSLIVKGLTLEKPEAGHGTGFDVAVDGWETVVVNIKG